ncbi:MAG: chemotaxis protein CheB [Bacteroidota bacterium]
MRKKDIKIEKPFSKLTKRTISMEPGFPIIGIGASAGGLEALEQFFQNIPKECGMAFVVIQHLDPAYTGMMPELLQRSTTMTVLQATDRLLMLPNHVYVIPPNKSMSVLNDALYLFEPFEIRGLRLPIDYFFRSLADDCMDRSVAIILSGMGSDGSLGVRAIKEVNGIVLLQDPNDAKFDGMPRSAMNNIIADIIAPAKELPAKLIALLSFNPAPTAFSNTKSKDKSNLEKIIILLRTQTGQDFSLYKKNTLFRRIERRMGVHLIDKIADYVRFIQSTPNEVDILFKELLIGVTNFFRDAGVWQMLQDEIFPNLFSQSPNGKVFRAWVPACSTGEEAYTLAMVFREALDKDKSNKNFTLQVFATDIDKDAVEIARKGTYGANIISDVPFGHTQKYFTKVEHGFHVNNIIREMIIFAHQNVIKDPPFTKLDLLSCRNMLIYMELELQKKLMSLFHYSLNVDGILLLGNAENENSQDNLFAPLDAKLKFYKRSHSPVTPILLDFPSSYSHTRPKVVEVESGVKAIDSIQFLAEELLLQHFAPASALINEHGDILFITGRTGKYLEPSAGKANMNIYAMARVGLSTHLMAGIRKAKQSFEPLILHNLKVGTNGGTQYVDVTIQHIEKPDAIKGAVMIVFADVAHTILPLKRTSKKGLADSPVHLQELELDLQRANEELQSTREEMQTSQEELKSINEELQSSNEELQSTNEELTTSKEEMQSMNEELQTVNVEMLAKINDFVVSNNDMKNLLNSTDIATLFLDKELNIRRYTSEITKIIKLRTSDVGRPFTEMVSDLEYPEIEEDARSVLRSLVFKETDISASNERWFKVRIMPYRTFDDRIDGLVITFFDISVAKNLEAEQIKSREILAENERMLRDSQTVAHIGSYVANLNAAKMEANTWRASSEIYKIFGIDKTYPNSIGGWIDIIHPDFRQELLAYFKQAVAQQIKFDREYKIIRFNDGAERWVQGIGELEYDKNGNPTSVIGAIHDITERKLAEAEIQELNKELGERLIMRTAQLLESTNELEIENKERGKRADELLTSSKERIIQNKEVKRLKAELDKAHKVLRKHNLL